MSGFVYLGNGCILSAMGLALFGAIAYAASRDPRTMAIARLGRAAIYGTFGCMSLATAAMVVALLANDFSVSYVAHVGSRETPRWVSMISLWSSLEGSILFWGWVLTGYSAACIFAYRRRTEPLFAGAGIVLLAVQFFFFLLLAMPANPFLPVAPVPDNGPGPNPLLQNHWLMALHPPCLYLGYIGFAVPFAFAVATLIERDRSGAWLRYARRFTMFAWSFLSIAIVLGGWWSYAVLGWGGYWAWDPVENASFMPWLAATAFLHSALVQERRGLLPVWTLVLAILTFILTILGTFLTRSGILESVHSFTESAIGPFFLAFIGVLLAASVGLLLWRSPQFTVRGRLGDLWSLEVLFLFNNLLLLSFCFIVFLGTFYPLVVEALRGARISVGAPHFNQMTMPIAGMLLLLLSVGVATPWRRSEAGQARRAMRWPGLLALLVTAAVAAGGVHRPVVLGLIALAAFAILLMCAEFARAARRRSAWRLVADQPRRYGGFVAHIGACIIVIAVAVAGAYKTEREVTLRPGESAVLREFTLTLQKVTAEEQPHRFALKAIFDVRRGDTLLAPLVPQMNFYPNSREPIATPAVRSTLATDLYLAPIQFERDGSTAAIRAIRTPLVAWIWIGGGVVMLGGLITLGGGRARLPEESA
ncbi:MAG: heme lyase CcmF/NrfE family subunit [Deltaproteobacteria bacterium]|nr:heme lyase CcmF/NrfE family subunit [Deltaproteobacteria bacterium]